MHRMFLITLIFCFLTVGAVAQQDSIRPVVVVKSTDRVKIEGKLYYIHIVRKGETLYSISKAYGVSQIDIAMENPDIYMGLQVDQALKIPVKTEDVKDDERYIYHVVRKGETLFVLSRKYQVPIDEIASVNPDVKSGLMLSQVVLIPKELLNTLGKTAPVRDTLTFVYHEVQPREGLYSIAKRYKVTQTAIEEHNRDLLVNGLKAGTILKIPQPAPAIADTKPLDDKPRPNTLEEVPSLQPKAIAKCDTFLYRRGKDVFNIAVILPFSSGETDLDPAIAEVVDQKFDSKAKPPSKENVVSPRVLGFLEFYEGFLLAVDSMKQQGVSVNLNVFDTKRDPKVIEKLIESNKLNQADLIIGPVYPEEFKPIASFVRQNPIPVVSPLASSSHLLVNNPGIIQVNPSIMTQIGEFIQMVDVCSSNNYLLVREDDSLVAPMVNQFHDLVAKKFNGCADSDQLHIKTFSYKPGSASADTQEKLNHSLNAEKENVVFIPSENEAFVSEFLGHLYALKSYHGYRMTVYGFPKWQKLRNIPSDYFYKLNIHLFTSFFVDYNRLPVIHFIEKYREFYRSEPSQFAFQGYDVGLYFISALRQYGRGLSACLPHHSADLLQSTYRFARGNETDGYENRAVFLINYTPTFEIVRK
jgi:LysM repeat protein